MYFKNLINCRGSLKGVMLTLTYKNSMIHYKMEKSLHTEQR